MRDLRQVDAQQKGISKEFGFVTFTQHSDALAALRAINNNPSIFTTQKVCISDPISLFCNSDKLLKIFRDQ
jgi:RNA recognition motif-containing protein